jgi:hypothetical protein
MSAKRIAAKNRSAHETASPPPPIANTRGNRRGTYVARCAKSNMLARLSHRAGLTTHFGKIRQLLHFRMVAAFGRLKAGAAVPGFEAAECVRTASQAGHSVFDAKKRGAIECNPPQSTAIESYPERVSGRTPACQDIDQNAPTGIAGIRRTVPRTPACFHLLGYRCHYETIYIAGCQAPYVRPDMQDESFRPVCFSSNKRL